MILYKTFIIEFIVKWACFFTFFVVHYLLYEKGLKPRWLGSFVDIP